MKNNPPRAVGAWFSAGGGRVMIFHFFIYFRIFEYMFLIISNNFICFMYFVYFLRIFCIIIYLYILIGYPRTRLPRSGKYKNDGRPATCLPVGGQYEAPNRPRFEASSTFARAISSLYRILSERSKVFLEVSMLRVTISSRYPQTVRRISIHTVHAIFDATPCIYDFICVYIDSYIYIYI